MSGHIASSKSTSWNTPESILKPVRDFFGGLIHLDPCSNDTSTVDALAKFSLPVDGLQQQWDYPTIFINPPYGRDKERKTSIRDWVEKAFLSHINYRSEIIMLIPAAVDTKHWQNFIFANAASDRTSYHARAICFLRGRVKFAGATQGPAPMACAIVYYGNEPFDKFATHFHKLGFCIGFNHKDI